MTAPQLLRQQATAAALQATAALTRPGSAELAEASVRWASPSPLWGEQLQTRRDDLPRPALLTLTSDNFMPELLQLLDTAPETLGSVLAQPPGTQAQGLSQGLATLKLFQAAHGHFNLAAGSLICRQLGLPDRALASGERVAMVLRRLDAQGQELAWTADPQGGRFWQARSAGTELAASEDLLPMFQVTFCNHDRKRRLWMGLVPASSQETFRRGSVAPPALPPDDPAVLAERQRLGLIDARLTEVNAQVMGQIRVFRDLSGPTGPQEHEAGLFVLLDLAEFLQRAGLLTDVLSSTLPAAGTAGLPLWQQLAGPLSPGSGGLSWRQALAGVWDSQAAINSGQVPATLGGYSLRGTALNPDTLSTNLLAAIGSRPVPPAVQPALPPTPKYSGARTRYLVRLVYLRPHCPPVVSEASAPFELAAFFDPDAPARPIHITLPADTSLAGLRKFKKNVSFSISKGLRQQLETVSNAKEALKGNTSAGQDFNLGMICSFSIPIITICAFVILLIFLVLLNIVFWWMPLFRICFPVPEENS